MKYTLFNIDGNGNKEKAELLNVTAAEIIDFAQTWLHYDAADDGELESLAEMTIERAILELEKGDFRVELREDNETQNEALKKQVLEIARELLRMHEEDIETGIEDRDYSEDDNDETRRFIKKATAVFDEFEKSQPAIFIYMEGGLIQGVSATQNIELNVYDADSAEDIDPEYIEMNGTKEEWDQKIDDKTATGEIKPTF